MRGRTVDGPVVEGSDKLHYAAVEIPTKDPTEYSYVERRAELLQQIRDLGHPSMLNQTEMGERYEVSQQQISKDLDHIADYIEERLGSRRDLVSEAVFHRSIQGLLEEEEYWKAAQTVKEWNDWLTDRKDMKELQEEIEFLKEANGMLHDNQK